MATETQLTAGLVASLEATGAVVVPYVASAMQPAGYPDRIIWSVAWRGWLELKGHNTPLATVQRARIDALNRRGWGSAWVFRFSAGATVKKWAGTLEDSRGLVFSCEITDAGILLAQLAFVTSLGRNKG